MRRDKEMRQRNEENMQEHVDRELFVKQLKEMLDWYTFHASDTEYEEGNVEYILKLLDSFDPIGEEELPQRDAAWERFRRMAEEKFTNSDSCASENSVVLTAQDLDSSALENSLGRTDRRPDSFASKDMEKTETGALENTLGEDRSSVVDNGEMALENALGRTAQRPDSFAMENVEKTKAGSVESAVGESGCSALEGGEAKAISVPTACKPAAKFGAFVARHKYIAAAVLVLLILAVSGTAQAIATQGADFFFWLKRDESGTQMMVSPEGLDDVMETNKVEQYESIDALPEWAQEWAHITEGVELPEGYEVQYFELSEFVNYQSVVGYYLNQMTDMVILLGAWEYYGKISYNGEEFIEYNYVRSYEVGETQMDIFNRTQENGNIYYAICFYKGNYQYLVKGQDDLDEVKKLAEQYLDCVQKY